MADHSDELDSARSRELCVADDEVCRDSVKLGEPGVSSLGSGDPITEVGKSARDHTQIIPVRFNDEHARLFARWLDFERRFHGRIDKRKWLMRG